MPVFIYKIISNLFISTADLSKIFQITISLFLNPIPIRRNKINDLSLGAVWVYINCDRIFFGSIF